MTAAQRQARRRQRLAKEAGSAASSVKRAKAKDKARAQYAPMPPGVTYWEAVTVPTADGVRKLYAPKTRPLAACDADLGDDDVLALLDSLTDIARQRGLKG